MSDATVKVVVPSSANEITWAPLLDKLERFVYSANRRISEKGMLYYQARAIETGVIVVPSPANGNELQPLGSLRCADNQVCYFFNDTDPFWLMTDEISKSRGISSAYYPSSRTIIAFSPIRVDHELIEFLDQETARLHTELGTGIAKFDVRPLIGHQNFAHHVWNELSPLVETIWEHALQIRNLYVTYSPIFDLSKALPAVNVHKIVAEREALSIGTLWVPIGGAKVSARTKRLCLDASMEDLTADEARVLEEVKTYDNIIWVSVRSHNRTLVNQVAALSQICAGVLSLSSRVAVVLDGFSLPRDIDSNRSYRAIRFLDNSLQLAQQTASVADEVILETERLLKGAAKRMYNGAGVRLPLSLSLASVCSFYICHHGTQQHKVGWFFSIPGVVHTNRHVIASKPAGWVRDQSEGSLAPQYVGEEDVRNSAKVSEPEYFGSYDLVNVFGIISQASNIVHRKEPTMRVERRSDVINEFTKEFPQCRYLEVGLWKAETFREVIAHLKVGIDPNFRFSRADVEKPGVILEEVKSDDYFFGERHKDLCFDVVFLDGLHTFEQTLRDFNNALVKLDRNGVIIIDDVLPSSYLASISDPGLVSKIRSPDNPFNDNSSAWMGDVYRLVYFIETFYPMIEFALVKETQAQLVCWRRRTARNILGVGFGKVEAISRVDYAHLLADYKRFNALSLADIKSRYSSEIGSVSRD
ncbi:class I SAM-dependent methyltransferase [Azospirillum sp. SYSU D00513]|uniref:class I SAM-dependent methyltransferase n=1 Tax=Azospirillum sp. SYSU D00513 TaxID=2812561 RepID=UPI001A978DEC|nr:class I SAM-dependent methyltransferase [Azospirillum sp. SYSU D00513]